MGIRIQLILIREPQPPVGIEHLLTKQREELLEHASSINTGPVHIPTTTISTKPMPKYTGGWGEKALTPPTQTDQ